MCCCEPKATQTKCLGYIGVKKGVIWGSEGLRQGYIGFTCGLHRIIYDNGKNGNYGLALRGLRGLGIRQGTAPPPVTVYDKGNIKGCIQSCSNLCQAVSDWEQYPIFRIYDI